MESYGTPNRPSPSQVSLRHVGGMPTFSRQRWYQLTPYQRSAYIGRIERYIQTRVGMQMVKPK